jgi:hypothetical protein
MYYPVPRARYTMRSFFPILLGMTLILLPALQCRAADPKSCAAMQRELVELRREYHTYAKRDGENRQESVKFDILVEILDKIIDLKRSMRAVNCKIRSRSDDLNRKR